MSLRKQHFAWFSSVLGEESWVTGNFTQLGLLLEQLAEVAAKWRDGSKTGVVSCFCKMVVSVGAGKRAELPSISQRSTEFRMCPGNLCVCSQLHLNSRADADSFQELGAECGDFLQQQGPSNNDLNHLFRRNVNGTPLRFLAFC